ncbi:cupredoxin domain-containing protein [Streptomyces sp. NPDC005151]
MGVAEAVVMPAAAVLIAGLGRFLYGPRRARTTRVAGGARRVRVTVRGGCTPHPIRVRQGVPLEPVPDRQESRDCTARGVVPDLRVSAALRASERTTVRLSPWQVGSFGLVCGMNMTRGTLPVAPAAEPGPGKGAPLGGVDRAATAGLARRTAAEPQTGAGTAAKEEAAHAAERKAEIRDPRRAPADGCGRRRCPQPRRDAAGGRRLRPDHREGHAGTAVCRRADSVRRSP